MPNKPQTHRLTPRASPQPRASPHRRGYTRRWERASKAYLAEHPLCECDDCRREGRLLLAEVVDHVVPHKGDQELFWAVSNWRAMAKRCHDRKTAKEDGGFGRRRDE